MSRSRHSARTPGLSLTRCTSIANRTSRLIRWWDCVASGQGRPGQEGEPARKHKWSKRLLPIRLGSVVASVGRPALTLEVQQAIINALRGGNYLETAGALAGISVSTLRNWLRAGRRNASPELAEFHRQVTQARASAEVTMVESASAATLHGNQRLGG